MHPAHRLRINFQGGLASCFFPITPSSGTFYTRLLSRPAWVLEIPP